MRRKMLMLGGAIMFGASLSGCGLEAVAAIQFNLSAPDSITAGRGGPPAPLTVTVTRIAGNTLGFPVTLALENPPAGVHADEVTVGAGQASATLNVFVDKSYGGPASAALTVKGTAAVNTQKAQVTLNVKN